jgi:branched-chain amino acid transport system ATP-binding protein
LANSALSLHDIDAYYGDSHVLQRVSFELGQGRLLGLLGRNGAGKSTCMNVSIGLLPPRGGAVEVFGAAVTRLPPELIASRWCRKAVACSEASPCART